LIARETPRKAAPFDYLESRCLRKALACVVSQTAFVVCDPAIIVSYSAAGANDNIAVFTAAPRCSFDERGAVNKDAAKAVERCRIRLKRG